MAEDNCEYQVRCKTCFTRFIVQLFENHEKCLWLVDNKDWYCDSCKKQYLAKQTAMHQKNSGSLGFPQLTGTPKAVAWAEKIRSELINKVNYLKSSLVHEDEDAKALSDKAFEVFFQEWQSETEAKWWINRRTTNVRDISSRIKEITQTLI
jgi:hypothetical protein